MKFSKTAWIYLLIVKATFSMELSVIPECYVDTNLIGPTSFLVIVTLIWRNKCQELDYLQGFFLVFTKGNIELYKHENRNHFIIRIVPAMERFILINAEKAGIKVEDFGLPVDFENFRKATKTVNSKKDPRFKQLFKALRDHQLEDLNRLTNCIKYLLDHPFNADLEILKTI
jgi:hypothetical protein